MEIDDITFELYKHYIGIQTKKDLADYLNKIQQQLIKYGPTYKCIDQFKFAVPRMKYRFFYNIILDYGKKKKDEPYLIDIGCCTGTDIRQLALDGYPSQYLIGLDNTNHFIQCGYDLFQDKHQAPFTFLQQDIFHPSSLQNYQQKVLVLMAGSLLHLFQSLSQIQQWFDIILLLLKPNALFVGAHVITKNKSSTMIQRSSSSSSSKFYLSQHDFYQLLVHNGFQHIQMEIDPHSSNHPDLCWLSYSAIYCPISPSNN